MRLLAITAEVHAFQGELNWEEPLRLGINLGGRPFIRMWQQRGDRVGFDDQPLQPEEFGEAGRVEVHDITDRLDPGLRNVDVSEVRIVEAGAEPVGLALLGPERNGFYIWIAEDRLHWANSAALATEAAGGNTHIGGLL